MHAFYFPSYVFLHLFEFPSILNLQNNYTNRKIMNVLTKRTEANLKKLTETVAQRCSVKKVFLDISQNSQENTSARVSFLIKLFSCEFCEISKNIFSCGNTSVGCFWIWPRFIIEKLKNIRNNVDQKIQNSYFVQFLRKQIFSFPFFLISELTFQILSFSYHRL